MTKPVNSPNSDGYQASGHAVTRRNFLKSAGAGAVLLGSGGVLAACGSGSGTAGSGAQGTASEGKPVAGGVLRVGASGGSNGDTLDAHNILNNADFPRMAQLYDPLLRMSSEGSPEFALADTLSSNKSATEWTIKLKRGVKFHDGAEFTAKDVLFSFKRIIAGNYPGALVLGPIDLKQSRAVNSHTVLLKFSSPYAILETALYGRFEYLYMVPVGYNPRKPIGTGPFSLKSFTPGRESVVVKFPDYWDHPKPYLDEVRTIDIADETAQVNALQSGQVDCIDFLSAGSIATLESANFTVNIAKTGGWVPFAMRVDRAPFSDNRVREAIKLSIDRPTMLQSVFAGNGEVGNDYFGTYDPAVKSVKLPQRVQDLEKAKSLLKQAGQSDLSVQLVTAALSPGMTQAAQVFSTQAAGAGIKTSIEEQTVTEYFARSYAKVPFSQTYWSYLPYLIIVSQATIKGAPFNETYFDNPKYNKLFLEATATVDEAMRTELIHEMVRIDWAEGGMCIPFFFPVIDGLVSNLRGVTPSISGQALSNFQFQNFWLA